MSRIDDVLEFIGETFVILTDRDFYLIGRQYDLSDEEKQQIIEQLEKDGWTVEDGVICK